jgi:hypothetical protein
MPGGGVAISRTKKKLYILKLVYKNDNIEKEIITKKAHNQCDETIVQYCVLWAERERNNYKGQIHV